VITLKRLYSETNLFNEINFKSGINIILGRYSNSQKREGINGIGKSSVIRLIDLAFVGEQTKKHFQQIKYAFLNNHSFCLEFVVKDKTYIIKRLFREKELYSWLKEGEVSFIEYDESGLKDRLATICFLEDESSCYVDKTWFRDLIRFFVKDDINRSKRTNPIDFMSDGKFKPSDLSLYYKNFFLLGLPNQKLIEYEEIDKQLKEQKKYKSAIINDIEKISGTKLEHLKSQQFEMEKEIHLLEKATQEYTFLRKYKEAEKELTNLESLISEKLLARNKWLKEKDNYERSLRVNLEADIEKVEKIYNEINTELAAFVRKTLSEVTLFRKTIAENRRSFLLKRQSTIKAELDKLFDEIAALEERRKNIYKMFNERRALDSLKNTYQDLIKKKTELEKSKANLQKIDELNIAISKIDIQLKSVKNQVIEVIQQIESSINDLRALFHEVLENSIFYDEDKKGFIFGITTPSKGSSPIKFDIDVPKSGSKGNEYFKLMAYDLTVFLNIIRQKRNIPAFLIHDGVYDELEPAKTVKILNYMYQQIATNPNAQYIIAANEFEFDVSENDKHRIGTTYIFNLQDHVIATFEDENDKMFFKQNIV